VRETAAFLLNLITAASSLGYPKEEVLELIARTMDRSGNPETGARIRKEGFDYLCALLLTVTNEKELSTAHLGSDPERGREGAPADRAELPA